MSFTSISSMLEIGVSSYSHVSLRRKLVACPISFDGLYQVRMITYNKINICRLG